MIERFKIMKENQRPENKQQETSPSPEQVYSEQNLWYFRTREGQTIGPFRYRSEAESNLDKFLADLKGQIESLS